MRRLIASFVLVGVVPPVGWAITSSVRPDAEGCYVLEVSVPPYDPEAHVCPPIGS